MEMIRSAFSCLGMSEACSFCAAPLTQRRTIIISHAPPLPKTSRMVSAIVRHVARPFLIQMKLELRAVQADERCRERLRRGVTIGAFERAASELP